MSTQAGCKPATLTSLPHDVLLHLLDTLPPSTIATYSQLCHSTHQTASDPSLWASIARRHLAISPPTPPTPATISALATSLIHRWWLGTGIFVAGVPVHFRKGFKDVRARGGLDVPVHQDSSDVCYVFGGRFKDLCVPVSMPSVSFDFFLDAQGAFPMDGMTLRLLHASEPLDPTQPVLSDLFLGPSSFENTLQQPPPDRARVRVKLNNHTIVHAHLPEALKFSVLDVQIDPDLLLTRPRVNTLVVEFDRASEAAYWLREVSLLPSILPLPNVKEEKLKFSVRVQPPGPPPHFEPVEEPQEDSSDTGSERSRDEYRDDRREERREARSRESNSPPPSPRAVAQLKHFVEPKVKHRGKVQRLGRKPKHTYHQQSYYRSPRGAPTSPKARR